VGRRLALLCLLAGCSRSATPALPAMPPAAERADATGAGKIEHVVFIVQENRSFDNLFQGYPGADTVSSGKSSTGERIPLVEVSLKTAYTLDHSANAMFTDCRGTGALPGTHCRMDGFDKEAVVDPPSGLAHPQYVYVPHDESKPYFDMAHEWVLSDRTFASQLDESFVAHQYIIAAQADATVNVPTGKWGCSGTSYDVIHTITRSRRTDGPSRPPCFNYRTLGDELDKAHRSWRFYTSEYGSRSSGGGALWSGYQAVEHIYDGPDWANVITPQKTFLTDVARGRLANFTWITPICANSDHVSCGGGEGPSWVTSLVDAIGSSRFWRTTAIFVQWDDWGGLYDHVPPPYRNYDSLGFRVPLLIISPYAKKGYVTHEQYETASVLRFAEDLFGLARLSPADRRARSPAGDCFDFAQRPRKFVPIGSPHGADFFLRNQARDDRPPDYE
jgi:phospholipase C